MSPQWFFYAKVFFARAKETKVDCWPNCSAELGVLPSGTSWGGLEITKKARKPLVALHFWEIRGE